MKSMKLYSDVHRIYNNLAALGIGPDDRLSVGQLTPFDQYHYDGTHAVDLALDRLGLAPGARLLDIGSGIGGPARYAADSRGVQVTALELQPDLDAVARDLTARCGLAGQVTHDCGDILDGRPRGPFDGIISMLCMLHIPEKARLFAACRAALKPGGAMYIEDFARARALSDAETDSLAIKVQSTDLPTPSEYRAHLLAAGFTDVQFTDVTPAWREVSANRVRMAHAQHDANVALHGAAIVAGLEDFYTAVDDLWQGGALSGLRILARQGTSEMAVDGHGG
jgi:cyclopropane fatty-acyl-phospholipid synthase-like methyltransferase